LRVLGFSPYYETSLGVAYLEDALAVLRALPDASVNAVITSPPYALHFKKEYGNVEKKEYVDWFLQFARSFFVCSRTMAVSFSTYRAVPTPPVRA
jgi:site-specific DNA-methyltransferase (cytosine-N4-specific)